MQHALYFKKLSVLINLTVNYVLISKCTLMGVDLFCPCVGVQSGCLLQDGKLS